jgi:hypothetical protein
LASVIGLRRVDDVYSFFYFLLEKYLFKEGEEMAAIHVVPSSSESQLVS